MNRVFILFAFFISLEGGMLFANSAAKVRIDVVSPVKASSKTTFNAQGVVQSKQNITIHSESDGFFKPKVFINSFIKKGKLIGVLKNSTRAIKTQSLKVQIHILKSSIQLQSKQLKNNQEMLKLGIISKNTMLLQQQQYKIQELKLQRLQQALDMLLLYQKHSNIYAPQSGYVKYIASNGQYLSYGALLASIVPNKRFVRLFINPSYLKYISKHQTLTLITPQGKQSATISAILPKSSSNLIEVIAKPAHRLPLGLHIQARLTVKNIRGWSLPKSAITIKDNKTAVFLIKNGVAHIYFVHILKDMLQTVIISNHLAPNDKIADKNAYMLSNKMKVEIQ